MSVEYTPTPTNHTSAQEYDDGDPPSAAIMNPLAEAAFDTAKWAANRVGTYRVIAIDEFDPGAGTTLLETSTVDTWTAEYSFGSISEQPTGGELVELIANPIVMRDAAGPIEIRFKVTTNGGTGTTHYGRESRVQLVSSSDMKAIPLLARIGPIAAGGATVYIQIRDPVADSTARLYGPCLVIAKLWRGN